jgi:hypothetical protein
VGPPGRKSTYPRRPATTAKKMPAANEDGAERAESGSACRWERQHLVASNSSYSNICNGNAVARDRLTAAESPPPPARTCTRENRAPPALCEERDLIPCVVQAHRLPIATECAAWPGASDPLRSQCSPLRSRSVHAARVATTCLALALRRIEFREPQASGNPVPRKCCSFRIFALLSNEPRSPCQRGLLWHMYRGTQATPAPT